MLDQLEDAKEQQKQQHKSEKFWVRNGIRVSSKMTVNFSIGPSDKNQKNVTPLSYHT